MMPCNLWGKPLDEVAIERIRFLAAEAERRNPTEGFFVGFSGGKDSVVLLDLFERSGVKHKAHYSVTTVDPPELVRFIRTFPQVQIDLAPKTMWRLIREHGCPPRRNMRYCCDELKERGGADNQIVATGVRWAESIRRSSRRMIEPCYRKARGRTLFHPIIEWTTDDVWQYIRVRGLRYCPLYDEGFTRLGCVMCPLTDSVEREMNRWPRIAALWKRAILDTYDPDKNGSRRFNSPEEYWDWWLRRGVSPTDGDTLFSNGIDYE